ncbi:MAG: GTP 3',8-cyclase MoaA [Ignavibacteriaceae bacterium]
MELIDRFNRKHDYLRISLTDKCNFNCIYCNPVDHLSEKFLREQMLSYEELVRIIDLFAGRLGFKKFRFTGGEPLIRKDIFKFFQNVKQLKDKYKFEIGLTTNGSLLKGNTKKLMGLGLDKLNISLDSLNPAKFFSITQKNEFKKVIDSIDEAISTGFNPLKINTVVIKNVNDDEIPGFVEYAIKKNINIRFIEFMPFGNNQWQNDGFISYGEIKKIVEMHYKLELLESPNSAVAKDYKIAGSNGTVSFISSMSDHFCSTCNRVRISSEGKFRLCLFAEGKHEINFKELFRQGLSDEEIISMLDEIIKQKWEKHPGAEELSLMIENNMLKIGG